MSSVLIGIMYVLTMVLIFGTIILISYICEKRRWNKGTCKCGGRFIFLENDYENDCKWYKCNKCNKEIDIILLSIDKG